MSASQAADLTFVVPGLFGPAPPADVDDEAALKSLVSDLDLRPLETLLSRARAATAAGPSESPEDLLFHAFGYPRPEGDWPAAAVSRAWDMGMEPERWCIRADPVHLKADMGDLVLFDGGQFRLELEEAKALAGIVNEHFSDAGWRIELKDPLRWYLDLETPARIRTAPLSMARLKAVDAHLPGGDEAGRWHGFLNETQMVLHDCAVNRDREVRGEVAVNSLWFWGGGALPPAPAVDWSGAYGDSAVLSGLAKRAGIECQSLPAEGDAWLKALDRGRHLAFIDAGHLPARARDVESWREFIADLSAAWFEPLLRGLDQGRIHGVTVLTDRDLRYHAGRTRWWRRLKARQPFWRLAKG